MAYRKTEKVLAHMEARSNAIIAAAVDVIAKYGIEALTVDNVAERAEISAGLIYKYFPNMQELQARIVQQLLERDLKAIREAAEVDHYPINTLATAVEVFYSRLEHPRLVKMLVDAPAYRDGIRDELALLLKGVGFDRTPKSRQLAAGAALGAIYGVYNVSGQSKLGASTAVLFVLCGIGVPHRAAQALADA